MRVGHQERLVPVTAARVVAPPRLGALQLPARTLLPVDLRGPWTLPRCGAPAPRGARRSLVNARCCFAALLKAKDGTAHLRAQDTAPAPS